MEPLYAKLYDKYSKLKTKKFGELEKFNKDQEEKFINYMTAAEELIQHLKDENDGLRAKVNELSFSTRPSVDDQGLDYQKLLMEEIQKNKQLSEEVEKLREHQKKGVVSIAEHGDGEMGQLNNLVALQNRSELSNGPTSRSIRKRSRPPEINAEGSLRFPQNSGRKAVQEDSENIFCQETTYAGDFEEAKQAPCCMRASGKSDDESTSICLFQALIQYILGMQFTVVADVVGVCISALHESSGYSFSLTLANEKSSGGIELTYTVQSLGTYERIAPEWMREVIKFSSSMCPVFFDRISRFVNVHH